LVLLDYIMKYWLTILATIILTIIIVKRFEYAANTIKTFDLQLKYREKDYLLGCSDSAKFFCDLVKNDEKRKTCQNESIASCQIWSTQRAEELRQNNY
jgi:hypothetical protein